MPQAAVAFYINPPKGLFFQGCAICVAHLHSNLRFRNLRFKKITAQIRKLRKQF